MPERRLEQLSPVLLLMMVLHLLLFLRVAVVLQGVRVQQREQVVLVSSRVLVQSGLTI